MTSSYQQLSVLPVEGLSSDQKMQTKLKVTRVVTLGTLQVVSNKVQHLFTVFEMFLNTVNKVGSNPQQ